MSDHNSVVEIVLRAIYGDGDFVRALDEAGYVIVPKAPTDNMIIEGGLERLRTGGPIAIYTAMLLAAPKHNMETTTNGK